MTILKKNFYCLTICCIDCTVSTVASRGGAPYTEESSGDSTNTTAQRFPESSKPRVWGGCHKYRTGQNHWPLCRPHDIFLIFQNRAATSSLISHSSKKRLFGVNFINCRFSHSLGLSNIIFFLILLFSSFVFNHCTIVVSFINFITTYLNLLSVSLLFLLLPYLCALSRE